MRYWRKLDNAAKIFPSAKNGHDTNVFRVYSELKENIEPKILQEAVNESIKEFPVYKSVMKKGLFWYYLEDTKINPIVKEEYKKPCNDLYDRDVKKLLFEVTYFNKRINLEVYHVLMDGTGAINFLKNIVYNYLMIKYSIKTNIEKDLASVSQKGNDSYKKFYEKNKRKNNKGSFAYKIKGQKTPNDELKIIEGTINTKSLIDKAHEFGVTLTALLIGILLKSIYEEMEVSDRKKSVVVSVPVNLRKYFDSETARNFFGVIFIKYNFKKQSQKLEDIVKFVDEKLKDELKVEKIKLRMNALISVEKNPVIRAIPLVLKNFVLSIAFKITESYDTTTVSNIGVIEIQKEFLEYISSFGMFVATNKLQLGVCSCNKITTISISSCFYDTDIQRRFFREIASFGTDVNISSN